MSFCDYVTAKQKTTGARLLRGMWCNILIGSVWVNDWTVEWQRGDGPGRGHHHHTVYTQVSTFGLANYIQCINEPINTNYIQLSRLIHHISIATYLCEEQNTQYQRVKRYRMRQTLWLNLELKESLTTVIPVTKLCFLLNILHILVFSKTRRCLVCNYNFIKLFLYIQKASGVVFLVFIAPFCSFNKLLITEYYCFW